MIYELDPLQDRRWPEFLERQESASAFHTPGWLRALRDTYGFVPLAITTSHPTSELQNGVTFCRVHSWLTGNRLVSIPYSDHCDLLIQETELEEVLRWVADQCRGRRYKYVEMRPLNPKFNAHSGLQVSERFVFHSLDLRPTTEELFSALDKKCMQGRIRRALKEELTCEMGRSPAQLTSFCQLMVLTRKRHRLPPQPIEWYRNLIEHLGDAVTIHLVRRGDRALAAVLTLRHKRTLIAKYSCSDQALKNLGAGPLLFWKVIEFAKASKCDELDLGRCELQDEGLATFKRRLGASSSELMYWRYSDGQQPNAARRWPMCAAKHVFSCMPQRLLSTSGRLLYKHFG